MMMIIINFYFVEWNIHDGLWCGHYNDIVGDIIMSSNNFNSNINTLEECLEHCESGIGCSTDFYYCYRL